MRKRPFAASLSFALGLVCTALVAGCGPRVIERETTDHGGDNLYTLSKIYSAAQQKLGRPPRSAEELKSFAKDYGDLDQLLVSPNDHQPYVIAWGTDMEHSPDPMLLVIYEKVGAGGFRYALTPTGTVKLTEERFAQANKASPQKPAGK